MLQAWGSLVSCGLPLGKSLHVSSHREVPCKAVKLQPRGLCARCPPSLPIPVHFSVLFLSGHCNWRVAL